MCAISGIIGLSDKVRDLGEIYKMMDIQKHRGPDDSGAAAFSWGENERIKELKRRQSGYASFDGAIAFNRLSIQDLSAAGHQPMLDFMGKTGLIFNGEIYNAGRLKEGLIQDGYSFHSRTDTEVILALYHKYGFTDMLHMLNGMFSIVIVDLREQRCYLARDRFGIKPLYYTIKDGFFYFSSEMKAILSIKNMFVDLNMSALAECINFRASYRRTMFRGINMLSPGEMMIVEGECIKVNRYFDINHYDRPLTDDRCSDRDAESELKYLLENAVNLQLISDVALGCQLSGGIDSSLITCFSAGLKKDPMKTVSIVFPDSRFTEESYINLVGERISIQQEKYLFTDREFLSLLEMAVWHNESILTHPNTICLMSLMRQAKKQLTVLLSGEGADELFGGYARFVMSLEPKGRASEDYVRATTTIPEKLRNALFPDLPEDEVLLERLELFESLTGTDFDKQIKYEFMTYLPELLLRQDKSSMAFSVENRVPFLDNDLVDFGFGLTQKQLLQWDCGTRQCITKMPLKKLAEDIFGSGFAYRRKMGFSVPVQNYIKNRKFREYFYDQIVSKASQREIMNTVILTELYEKISETAYDYHELECFWRGLTLEILCQLYGDGRECISI